MNKKKDQLLRPFGNVELVDRELFYIPFNKRDT